MIVPSPAGGDDEVAGLHGGALAIDSGECAAAFHNEAKCTLGVAVAGGHFAGQNQLQTRIQSLGNAGFAPNAGVFQNQHAAYRLFSSDEFACTHQIGPHLFITPQGGQARRLGVHWHEVVQHLPQRGEVERINVSVKLFPRYLKGVCRGACDSVHDVYLKIRFKTGVWGRCRRTSTSGLQSQPIRCRFETFDCATRVVHLRRGKCRRKSAL